MRAVAAVAVASFSLLAACATQPMPQPGQDAGIDRAVGQPFRDLSLIREVAPPALLRAAAGPYDMTQVRDCAAAQAEVAELDAALGPDLAPVGKASGLTVQGVAANLVGGAIGLPFRGVVRHVTGAEQRDQALRAAVLAGMVRRGFLKGRMAVTDCALPPPPAPAKASPRTAMRN
jgi:hypothetical protein